MVVLGPKSVTSARSFSFERQRFKGLKVGLVIGINGHIKALFDSQMVHLQIGEQLVDDMNSGGFLGELLVHYVRVRST